MLSSRLFKAASFVLPAIAAMALSPATAGGLAQPAPLVRQRAPGAPQVLKPQLTVAGGDYLVTYYNLAGTNIGTNCIVFTLDSGVNLGSNGGFWSSLNGTVPEDYEGNWIVQNGNELRFYGASINSSSEPTGYITHQAKLTPNGIVTYGFDAFNQDVTPVTDGTFTMVPVSNCASVRQTHDRLGLAAPDDVLKTPSLDAQSEHSSVRPDLTMGNALYSVDSYPFNGSPSAHNCLYFKKDVNVGLGSKGGRWYSTQFSDFRGLWVVQGRRIRFYGAIKSHGGVVSYYTYQGAFSKTGIVGYGYDDFNPSLDSYSDGTITITADPGCTNGS